MPQKQPKKWQKDKKEKKKKEKLLCPHQIRFPFFLTSGFLFKDDFTSLNIWN